jgi:hypothetical protein
VCEGIYSIAAFVPPGSATLAMNLQHQPGRLLSSFFLHWESNMDARRWFQRGFILLCGLTLASGCGGGAPAYTTAPVSGTVKLDGKPLGNAMVQFHPTGEKHVQVAVGRTDADGRYELQLVVGGAKSPPRGAIPGDYKVTVSKFAKPDGTEIPANSTEPPANLGAFESLPMPYTNPQSTPLLAKVPEAGVKLDFEVDSKFVGAAVPGMLGDMMPR